MPPLIWGGGGSGFTHSGERVVRFFRSNDPSRCRPDDRGNEHCRQLARIQRD